jgi:glucokinase
VSIPTNADRGVDAVIGGILKSCELLAEKTGFNKADLKAIGIGVPGMMNVDTGEVIFCPNLPIEHVNITNELREKWNVRFSLIMTRTVPLSRSICRRSKGYR